MIVAEINEIKKTEKVNKIKSWFSEKTDEINVDVKTDQEKNEGRHKLPVSEMI
jgi:hypothetical protein